MDGAGAAAGEDAVELNGVVGDGEPVERPAAVKLAEEEVAVEGREFAAVDGRAGEAERLLVRLQRLVDVSVVRAG